MDVAAGRSRWWMVALAVLVAALSLAALAWMLLHEVADNAAAPPVRIAPQADVPQLVAPNTLVRGIVLAGGAPAAGVAVDVAIWPNERVQMHLRTGERVPTLDLGTVTTADDGTFVVVLDPARLSRKYTGGDRMVDVEVNAHLDNNRWTSWDFTATLARQQTAAGPRLSWSTYEADRAHHSQPITLDIDLDAGPTGVTEHRISG